MTVVFGVSICFEHSLLGHALHKPLQQLSTILYFAANCLQVFVPFNDDDPNRRIITNAQLSDKNLGTELGERESGREAVPPV